MLDIVASSLEGGGPTLPLWGRVVTWMIVSCVWVVGMEGCFVDGFVLVGDGE